MRNTLGLLCLSALVALKALPASAQVPAVMENPSLAVPQWVQTTASGSLSGIVSRPLVNGGVDLVPNALVVLVDQRGRSVYARTNDVGDFVFSNIQPGIYAMATRAANVFGCYAIQVVPQQNEAADYLPKRLSIAVGSVDYMMVKSLLMRYMPAEVFPQTYTFANADFVALQTMIVGNSSFRVQRVNDGLTGRISAAGAGPTDFPNAGRLNVFLLRGPNVIDRVVTDQNGRFVFAGVETGDYTLMAYGEKGLGVVGMELVDKMPTTLTRNGSSASASGETYVTMQADGSADFAIQIVPLNQALPAIDQLDREDSMANVPVDQFGNPIGGVDQFGNPIGGGALGGGPMGGGGLAGGGGGGGGGFGGGLGGLAGLAGLAAIAASNNDNNSLDPAPVISPTRPAP